MKILLFGSALDFTKYSHKFFFEKRFADCKNNCILVEFGKNTEMDKRELKVS